MVFVPRDPQVRSQALEISDEILLQVCGECVWCGGVLMFRAGLWGVLLCEVEADGWLACGGSLWVGGPDLGFGCL